METTFEILQIPEYDLEAFMKSITYQPKGMSVSLARQMVTEEGEKLPAPLREARILRKALELLPIGINSDDLIAGNYGEKFADEEYLRQAREADEREFDLSVEYKYRSEEERIASSRYLLFGIYTPSHTTVNYPLILRAGLKHYEKQIRERLSVSEETDYACAYWKAMLECIDTVRMFENRYVDRIGELLEGCDSEERRAQLERMRKALRKVPYEPAKNLFEALQGMWIIHTVTPASDRSWASVSLGQMDVFLLDYYKSWLQEGHTREEAMELFGAFFKLLDSYGDGSGTLNLGPDWNELSLLLLEVEKRERLRAPIIAVRMRKDTPEEIYRAAVDKTLFQIGQPTFYGEGSCVKAMKYRGIPEEEGHAINSCMGMAVPGKEIADMWGCCVNMSLPLELALNHGKPLHGTLPDSLAAYVDSVPVTEPADMGSIRLAYEAYMQAVVSYVAHQNLTKAAWIALNRPNPFLSMLTENCILYGRDRAHSAVSALGSEARAFWPEKEYDFENARKGRGAVYHNVTVLAMGFAHAADALTALETLVFEEKRYTVGDFLRAAADNYSGEERNARLYAELMHCGKYAAGCERADQNASFVLNALADACETNYRGNIRFLPTCHTIDSNVQFGSCAYAGLDGRRDGEAYGKNAGPVLKAIKNTPVDLMLGEAKLPNERFSGGMPIDVYVPDNILDGGENRDKFIHLLRTYFELGGMQVQVNNVDVELLKKAYAEPEKYSQVIVRKGGFSIYFTDMFREVQKDMIERFEMELKG